MKPNDPYEKETTAEMLRAIECSKSRFEKYHQLCEQRRSVKYLRAPVICIFGPKSVGKSSLVNCIRCRFALSDEVSKKTVKTNLQYIPVQAVCKCLLKAAEQSSVGDIGRIPGLMLIETTEHEILKNLTLGGSPLFDLVLVVIDLISGMDHEIRQSIRFLTSYKIPFLVVLNKVNIRWKDI